MKRIYFFMFLSVWMFAACSSNSGTVKSDAPTMDVPAETSASKVSDEVFHHPGAGFSMVKPMQWNYLSPEMVKAASESTKWNDTELEEMIKKNPNVPLVVITRYQEPYPTLNTSVSVTMLQIPVEGIPPKDLLKINMEVFKRAFPDLTYVDEVQDANVDGINGAYTKVKFTMASEEKKFPTLSRFWLVPRGKTMFAVNMTSPQEDPDVSEESFSQILKSIKIEQK